MFLSCGNTESRNQQGHSQSVKLLNAIDAQTTLNKGLTLQFFAELF